MVPWDTSSPCPAEVKHFCMSSCRYHSVKSLPEAMRMEEEEAEEEEEKEDSHALEVDGPAPVAGTAKTSRMPPKQQLAQAERGHGVPLE